MCAYWHGLQRRSVCRKWMNVNNSVREREQEEGKEWLRCPTPSNTREPAVVPLFPWRWGWAVCSKLRTVWDVRQGIMICGMRESEEEEVNDEDRVMRWEQVVCVLHFEWAKTFSANRSGLDLLLQAPLLVLEINGCFRAVWVVASNLNEALICVSRAQKELNPMWWRGHSVNTSTLSMSYTHIHMHNPFNKKIHSPSFSFL